MCGYVQSVHTRNKMGNILKHAIGYFLFVSIFCIAWADIRMGTIKLEKSVISTFQLFYKVNQQHHPLNQSSQ